MIDLINLFVSLLSIILDSLMTPYQSILVLIMILSAALLTLTKWKEIKYPLLKNLSVLKYV